MHYVVICDWSVKYTLVQSGVNISGVAHTLEDAKEILALASVDEEKYAKDNNWTIYKNSDVEFDAGEKDNYEEEHSHFYIEEVE